MGKVFITDYISNPDIENKVLGNVSTDINDPDIEVLLVWHKIIDEKYLDNFKNLKGMIRYGVGTDNIDFEEVKKRNLYLCNTPDYGIEEVSDTAIAFALNFVRGILEYDLKSKLITDGSWQENTIESKRRTSSLTFGVLGAGRIGSSVLLKAKAIGFNTVFFDPYKEQGHEKIVSAYRCNDLGEFLSNADIISINAVLTEETKSMVDNQFVERMKNGSYLINTARGKIIDDLDIFIDPIKAGKISGIGLDVLPDEPPNKQSELINSWLSSESWTAGKVIINPHAGYYSKESYVEMRKKAAINAKRIIDKLEPTSIVIRPQK
mgnify:FL=1